MSVDRDAWSPPSGRGTLCVDTSGLFAYFYPGDADHERAREFVEWIRGRQTAPWRLFVNDYVLDELLTLLVRKSDRRTAIRALERIRASDALSLDRVPDGVFEAAMDAFADYDDQSISFTDHVVSAHATARDAHVFTFDATDFAVLGNAVVPREP